ncbi:MAG: tRNA threonylcarbamoyladenosine dehydratase [Nitrosomonadales bacterium]|nr:tRNA threonylcarbamoyladenosine dehydratase [Nitrosomonadales bacterium]
MRHTRLDNDHARRFGGLDRLYGDGARMALHRARVAVVGLGGVGSWVAEALARSGIGNITLIDFDHVAVSNVNRQIHALDSTRGMAKVQVLESRIRDINPDCRVSAVDDFLTTENIRELIPADAFDVVIDACDDASAKAALIVHARQHTIWVVICGATGGKSDPLKLRHSDLGLTAHDSLLLRVRKLLRSEAHILPRKNGKYGVDVVYVDEHTKKGEACTTGDLNCSGYGSVVTVTASMGLAAAALCVDRIAKLLGSAH